MSPVGHELFFVEAEETTLRLDVLISRRFSFSRTAATRLIDKGFVMINGERLKKRAHLREGDEVDIEFPLPEFPDLTPEKMDLSILFEDDHLIVLDKPAGLVVHPAVGNWTGTLVHGLLYHCKGLPHHETLRPGIVHRLDKDTSGVMVVAKTETAHRQLVEQFATRKVEKEYVAIVIGKPPNKIVSLPIGRDPIHRQRMAVVESGKPSETTFETLQFDGKHALVRALPKTGRTHQIRVHLKHLGTPVLFDPLYGKGGDGRHLLHAKRLTFFHPQSGEKLFFEAELPSDFFLKI